MCGIIFLPLTLNLYCQGQALAKINIGAVLDSAGDWAGALQSFEEGYRFLLIKTVVDLYVAAAHFEINCWIVDL